MSWPPSVEKVLSRRRKKGADKDLNPEMLGGRPFPLIKARWKKGATSFKQRGRAFRKKEKAPEEKKSSEKRKVLRDEGGSPVITCPAKGGAPRSKESWKKGNAEKNGPRRKEYCRGLSLIGKKKRRAFEVKSEQGGGKEVHEA